MKSNFKKMVFAILIVLISNGIAYSQRVEVDISPKFVDFGTIPLDSIKKEVPLCITNTDKVDIYLRLARGIGFIGGITQDGWQAGVDDPLLFAFLVTPLSSAFVYKIEPYETAEFYAYFFGKTVGQTTGTIHFFAGTEFEDATGTIVFTDTIRISLIGNCTDNEIISVKTPEEIPTTYSLSQNYPNPFNPTTTIKYKIPTDGLVKLTVFDITGKFIQELVNGYKVAGTYYVGFDASRHASGTYFYKIEAGDYKSIQKMMVVK
jgi:hypothetical protein